jgi:hypothetical protein
MRNLALRLIAAEARPRNSEVKGSDAAFRVCEKVRASLSALVGVRGFRSLMARALALAQAEVAWLGGVEIGADGLPVVRDGGKREMASSEAAKGGAALVAHLLGLLATFIGEALTRRLVQQVWPKTALEDSETGDNS